MSEEKGERQQAAKSGAASDAKAERLAAALRANLRRRKAQARDRAALQDEPGSAPGETGPKIR